MYGRRHIIGKYYSTVTSLSWPVSLGFKTSGAPFKARRGCMGLLWGPVVTGTAHADV